MEKHMNRRTFSRTLKELEAGGFITKEQTGGLFRQRNWFRFSEAWRQGSSGNTATVTSGNTATVEHAKESRKRSDSGKRATC
jgi:DNA-binding transcriptional regulator YhcF (GntR family)